jgi:hypothetical protein
VLTDTPIQIHENHFSKPLERNDILNAPAHLPVPTLRFSIRQISVVWYIYGGSDFALPKPSQITHNRARRRSAIVSRLLDDSHQQPVQLNINESVRFTATTAAASPPSQYVTKSIEAARSDRCSCASIDGHVEREPPAESTAHTIQHVWLVMNAADRAETFERAWSSLSARLDVNTKPTTNKNTHRHDSCSPYTNSRFAIDFWNDQRSTSFSICTRQKLCLDEHTPTWSVTFVVFSSFGNRLSRHV